MQKTFFDDTYLLDSPLAVDLYRRYAKAHARLQLAQQA